MIQTIKHPDDWNLSLHFAPDSIIFNISHIDGAEPAQNGEIPLGDNYSPYVKRVQNCIYDNPALLQEFARVRIVVESSQFQLMPAQINNDEFLAEDIMAEVYPDAEGDLCTCTLAASGIIIAFFAPRGLVAFLNRTFNNAPIVHHLHSLATAAENMRGNHHTMMIDITKKGSMDVCLTHKGHLLLANSFEFKSVEDARFFLLNIWQSFHLDAHTDVAEIRGGGEDANALISLLKEYVATVTPASAW